MFDYYTMCIFVGVIHQSAGLRTTPYLNLQVPATQTMYKDQNNDVSYLRQASSLGIPLRRVEKVKEENDPFQCETRPMHEVLSGTHTLMTIDSPEPYKKCKFPFMYNGNIYSSCATTQYPDKRYLLSGLSLTPPQNPLWCATEVRWNHEVVDGKWGFCSDGCLNDRILNLNSKVVPLKENANSVEYPSTRRNFVRGGRHQSRHPYYTRYYGHHYGYHG